MLTNRALHVDTLLTDISIAYKNADYIADQIFPVVPVRKQSDKIPAYDQSYWFRNEAALRAPGTKSVRGGYKVDTSAAYYCNRFSFAHEIPDELRDNADVVFNLDREAVEYVSDKVQMRREASFAADFFTTSVWGADKTGGTDFTRWSDYGASDPLVDLADYQELIEGQIGRTPNTLVLGRQVWTKLKWHPVMVDLVKHTRIGGPITLDAFRDMAEFERLLVGKAIYTASPEGTAEASVTYSRIWGKHGLMAYIAPRPSLMTPSAGYTFVWDRPGSGLQYIKRFRDEEREVDIFEANTYFDQKVTAARAGIFISGAVA
ncbi:MAG: hypothetical protein U0556_09930 [Dehalococcoidia bacterium]